MSKECFNLTWYLIFGNLNKPVENLNSKIGFSVPIDGYRKDISD